MADSFSTSKRTFHTRSNSLPSRSHPVPISIEDDLRRFRASEATTSSICSNLATLGDLHKGLNDLIQLPSIQKVLSSVGSEVLDGSLRLLDGCSATRDVIILLKESIIELELFLRRQKGKNPVSDEINSFASNRKKIIKMVKRIIRNYKGFDKISSSVQLKEENNVVDVLREVERTSFSVLKSILSYACGRKEIAKQTSWAGVSKFLQQRKQENTNEVEKIDDALHKLGKGDVLVQDVQKQLMVLAPTIQELEEGLDSIFRSLIKTRASLLNVLSL